MAYNNRDLRKSRPASVTHVYVDADTTVSAFENGYNKGYDINPVGGDVTIDLRRPSCGGATVTFTKLQTVGVNQVFIDAGLTPIASPGGATILEIMDPQQSVTLVYVLRNGATDYWAIDVGNLT